MPPYLEPIQKRSNPGYKPRDIRTAILLVATLLAFCAVSLWAASSHRDGSSLSIRDNFNSGSMAAWEMPFSDDWEILQQDGLHYLHMKRSRPPGIPRRPLQFARLKGVDAGSFDLNVKVRRAGGSMIVVFDYVDTLHFYYVHLSKDSGTKVSAHNGIFIVNDGSRRRIAGLDASAALPDLAWHDVRIVRDAGSGSIQVFLDQQTTPRFSVIDHSFPHGQVGLGSFDETGDFAQLRLHSDTARRSARNE